LMKFSTASMKAGVRGLERPPWRCLQRNKRGNSLCSMTFLTHVQKNEIKNQVCATLSIALPVHNTKLSVRWKDPLGPQVLFSPDPSRHRHRSQRGSNNPISSFQIIEPNLGSTGAAYETCCRQTWVPRSLLGEKYQA
jgi:hypothetical protein